MAEVAPGQLQTSETEAESLAATARSVVVKLFFLSAYESGGADIAVKRKMTERSNH